MNIAAKETDETQSNGRAIATICIGVVCLVLSDAMAKWLTAHYAPLQIIFVRNLVALPLIATIATIALSIGGRSALRSLYLAIHAIRGILMVGGACTFFQGLKILPRAEAMSLVFAAPIFITALSVPLLGEHVGWANLRRSFTA